MLNNKYIDNLIFDWNFQSKNFMYIPPKKNFFLD